MYNMDAVTGGKVLPMEERLKKFDEEVQKLYNACKDAGYDPDKIRETAFPLLRAARRGQWKIRAKRGLVVVAAIFIFAAAFVWPPTHRAMGVVTKKLMVKTLPYYDWTWMFTSECFMNNPYFVPVEETLTEDDCDGCSDLKNLTVQINKSSDAMSDEIFKMIPNIVGDAMFDWRAAKDSVTFDDIIKMHLRVPSLNTKENFCYTRISHGFPIANATVTQIVQFVDEERKAGRRPNFTANWMTCNVDAFKEMHKLYYKPYHIPAMCEPIQHRNYLLTGIKSAASTKALYLKARNDEPGMWVAQVYGNFEFLLQPVEVCRKICHNLRFNLTQGQILNIPFSIFKVAYRPSSEEAVAIGVGYSYN